MADTLKDIPEFFETELGESIIARTDALGNFESKVFSGTRKSILIRRYSSRYFSRVGSSRLVPYYQSKRQTWCEGSKSF